MRPYANKLRGDHRSPNEDCTSLKLVCSPDSYPCRLFAMRAIFEREKKKSDFFKSVVVPTIIIIVKLKKEVVSTFLKKEQCQQQEKIQTSTFELQKSIDCVLLVLNVQKYRYSHAQYVLLFVFLPARQV